MINQSLETLNVTNHSLEPLPYARTQLP